MGYHNAHEIPNYWAYARHFVLQDHMFESDTSWSLPSHLFLVSGWSAHCTKNGDPMSCHAALEHPGSPPETPGYNGTPPDYAWTDLTYLMHRDHVSWGYYLKAGTEPDCENDQAVVCGHVGQQAVTPGIWNPLPDFTDVRRSPYFIDQRFGHE